MEPEVISRMSVLDQQEREAYELLEVAKAVFAAANQNFEAAATERRLFIEQYVPELSWRNHGRNAA